MADRTPREHVTAAEEALSMAINYSKEPGGVNDQLAFALCSIAESLLALTKTFGEVTSANGVHVYARVESGY